MKRHRLATDRSALGLWLLRLALVASLVVCSLYSKAFWSGRFTIKDCLGEPQRCMGRVVETKPLLLVEKKVGDLWMLRVEKLGVALKTRSALPGVQPEDVLEASVTFVGDKEIAIHDYAILRPWRTAVRTIVSIVTSFLSKSCVLRLSG